jgi:hypothetical protein
MRKLIGLLTCLIMIGSTASAQQKQIKEVAEAAEALRAVMVDPSKQIIEGLMMDSLGYGHSNGHIEDKKTFIANLMSGASDFVSIDITDQHIQCYENTAIVRHTLSAVTNDNAKPGTVKLYVLQVWIKEKGKWKLAGRQAVKAV